MTKDSRTVLAVDLATGGVTAALVNTDLEATAAAEVPWRLVSDEPGAAVLPADTVRSSLTTALRQILDANPEPAAIAFSGMMHTLVCIGDRDEILTPVFTWLDRRGADVIPRLEKTWGDDFHDRTGCHYHPMFPVFKLEWLRTTARRTHEETRFACSLKALAIHDLCGEWAEDETTIAASGITDAAVLPRLRPRAHVCGTTAAGIPVVNGSADGLLAHLGSCGAGPSRLSVTFGTSASVRRLLPHAVHDHRLGMFCYSAEKDQNLVGMVTSNGGNVMDWARAVFGSFDFGAGRTVQDDVPIFLPMIHGERSPEWNAELTGSWHRLRAEHSTAALHRSIVEGITFTMASFIEKLETVNRERVESVILSGNGFLQPHAPELLACLIDRPIHMPAHPGLASLRGAAICGFEAIGVEMRAAVERLAASAGRVRSMDDPGIRRRYRLFQELRRQAR